MPKANVNVGAASVPDLLTDTVASWPALSVTTLAAPVITGVGPAGPVAPVSPCGPGTGNSPISNQ